MKIKIPGNLINGYKKCYVNQLQFLIQIFYVETIRIVATCRDTYSLTWLILKIEQGFVFCSKYTFLD